MKRIIDEILTSLIFGLIIGIIVGVLSRYYENISINDAIVMFVFSTAVLSCVVRLITSLCKRDDNSAYQLFVLLFAIFVGLVYVGIFEPIVSYSFFVFINIHIALVFYWSYLCMNIVYFIYSPYYKKQKRENEITENETLLSNKAEHLKNEIEKHIAEIARLSDVKTRIEDEIKTLDFLIAESKIVMKLSKEKSILCEDIVKLKNEKLVIENEVILLKKQSVPSPPSIKNTNPNRTHSGYTSSSSQKGGDDTHRAYKEAQAHFNDN
jgi:uncharacterized membrane-anchored protein YhcB (DUF1043 family)